MKVLKTLALIIAIAILLYPLTAPILLYAAFNLGIVG